MATFTKYILFADGILVFHNQDMTVDWPNVNQAVSTVPGGQVGPAPGAEVCNISIKNAKPKAGADYKWNKARRNRVEVEIRVKQPGSSEELTGKFIVNSYQTGSSVDGEPTESIEMSSVGSPAPIFE